MKSIKKPIKYAIWILIFFVFSNFLINMCLETSYSEINCKKDSNMSQVEITDAEATKVNGRIKGKVVNSQDNKIKNKFLKFDFFSKRDVLLGSKYIDVSTLRENETKDIDMHFKLQDVDYYKMSFTDKEPTQGEIQLLPEDMNTSDIFWGTFLAYLIFW